MPTSRATRSIPINPRRPAARIPALRLSDLFLASIGTCAGFYVVQFCRSHRIDTDDLEITLEPIRDEERHRVAKIRLGLKLPTSFPAKYRAAIRRVIDQCAVKRHILEPPRVRSRRGVTARFLASPYLRSMSSPGICAGLGRRQWRRDRPDAWAAQLC